MSKIKTKMFTISHSTLLVFANRVSVPLILACIVWVGSTLRTVEKTTTETAILVSASQKEIDQHDNRINRLEGLLMKQSAENTQGGDHAIKPNPIQLFR